MVIETVLANYVEIGVNALQAGWVELADTMFRAAAEEARGGAPVSSREAAVFHDIAAAYCRLGRLGEAKTLYKRALAVYVYTLGQYSRPVRMVLERLAEVSIAEHKFGQATQFLKRAVTAADRDQADNSVEMATLFRKLAWTYLQLKRMTEADDAFRQALKYAQRQSA